jgi:nucleoside-diphosphate-sugar epimerase
MQIVVTGACSDLGQALLRAIVARAQLHRTDGVLAPVARVLGVDRSQPAELFVDERIEYVRAQFEQPRFLARVMGAATDAIFHLSTRSAAANIAADIDGLELAWQRSVDTTRALLDACRFQPVPPRVVHAGRAGLRAAAADVPPDIEAACIDLCETVLVESARMGLVDLRSVRLPAALGAAAAAQALLEAHEWGGPAPALRIFELGQGGALRQTVDR